MLMLYMLCKDAGKERVEMKLRDEVEDVMMKQAGTEKISDVYVCV